MDKISHIKHPVSTCRECKLYNSCLPKSLNKNELNRFEKMIKHKAPLREGEHLFRQGNSLKNLYVIRVGSCKCYSPTIDGRQNISGFYLPGKILGLNAVAGDIHPDSAKVLETSSFCEIPYNDLRDLCYQIPSLQKQYINMICNELLDSQALMLISSKNKAENRLASFLISVSQRMKLRGYSCTDFNMSMARIDIANYLCLANETVSRVFSRFQTEGLIATKGKYVKLLNLHKLNELAGIEVPLKYQESV